jgi:hypothetical protein
MLLKTECVDERFVHHRTLAHQRAVSHITGGMNQTSITAEKPSF